MLLGNGNSCEAYIQRKSTEAKENGGNDNRLYNCLKTRRHFGCWGFLFVYTYHIHSFVCVCVCFFFFFWGGDIRRQYSVTGDDPTGETLGEWPREVGLMRSDLTSRRSQRVSNPGPQPLNLTLYRPIHLVLQHFVQHLTRLFQHDLSIDNSLLDLNFEWLY